MTVLCGSKLKSLPLAVHGCRPKHAPQSNIHLQASYLYWLLNLLPNLARGKPQQPGLSSVSDLPACTSAWNVSAPSTLANQVLSAAMRTDSGSFDVMERMESRSVRGTPDSCSITSILQNKHIAQHSKGIWPQKACGPKETRT